MQYIVVVVIIIILEIVATILGFVYRGTIVSPSLLKKLVKGTDQIPLVPPLSYWNYV